MDQGTSFCGAVAVITGGGGGIGQAVARRIVAGGGAVAVMDINGAAARTIARELGEQALDIEADCADPAAVRDAVGRVEDRFGGPSILIQSHGVVDPCPSDKLDRHAWNNTLAVNLTGCYNLLEACVPGMIERRLGRILHIASISAHRGAQNRSLAYAASKGALISMTKLLGTQLGQYGITANSLSPGLARSEINAHLFDAMPAGALENAIPLGRAASLDEMADAAAYLVGPHSTYVNGVDLVVDGGLINSYRVAN